MPSSSTPLLCLIFCLDLAGAGCSDHGKAAEEHATHAIDAVSKRAAADVKNLELGLPAAASKLGSLFADGGDPSNDLTAVRAGLRDIRATIPELTRSNSTFFALADAHGVALRNDLPQDVMAGQDLWRVFPDLRRTTEAGFVTATGVFGGGRPGEVDRDWVAAAPLKDAHGAYGGMVLGGWTMRRLAYHLEEVFRQELADELVRTKDPGKPPIFYVFVFDPTGVYAGPATPEVTRQAVVDLGLVGKTASGVAHGVLSISDRDYGYAGVRVPALEKEGGLVVLWSDV